MALASVAHRRRHKLPRFRARRSRCSSEHPRRCAAGLSTERPNRGHSPRADLQGFQERPALLHQAVPAPRPPRPEAQHRPDRARRRWRALRGARSGLGSGAAAVGAASATTFSRRVTSASSSAMRAAASWRRALLPGSWSGASHCSLELGHPGTKLVLADGRNARRGCQELRSGRSLGSLGRLYRVWLPGCHGRAAWTLVDRRCLASRCRRDLTCHRRSDLSRLDAAVVKSARVRRFHTEPAHRETDA